MTTINESIDAILRREPHLTRDEAIQLFLSKRTLRRKKKQIKTKIIRNQERKMKGKKPKKTIKFLSGGAVSPR
ncbi:hypothetical protein JYB87_00420 [Shewanella avicenniae]|uniref:Uncharacterized protein n=1 Tax=Shewanella avicenniae TaxID=2814294 RepID=A0ABX7QST3_9GAMM|nr:hypothetical protein [Shewanella avicenniae]QSX33755.1 hypothetical protein JYB87_00420 [Shewanella avicenniae]